MSRDLGPDRHPSAESFQALIDGDLSASRARALRDHLRDCERCAAEFAAWHGLYSSLSRLPHLEPAQDLTEGVMARLPTPVPLGRRLRQVFGTCSANGHLESRLIDDLVEGVLPKRRSALLRKHASSCARCATEINRTRETFEALSELGHLAPSQGFADRVLAAMGTETETSPESVGTPARLVARLKEHLHGLALARPRTMEGWAGLCGFAVTPTVCLALVFHSVLSHPTVGLRELLQYASWQLGELADTAARTLSSLALDWANALGGTGAYRTVSDQPEWLVFGVALYGMTCALAAVTLYRMIGPRIRGRHRAHR